MATDDNSELHGNTIEYLNECNDATIKRLIKKLDPGQLREILIDRVVKDENRSIAQELSPIKKIYSKTIYYRKDKLLSDDAWNNIMEFAVIHTNVPNFTIICTRFRNLFSNPHCFIYRKFAVLLNENESKLPPTPNNALFNYKLILNSYGHQQIFMFEAIAATFSLHSVNEIISRFSTHLISFHLMADFSVIYDPNKDGSNMRININCPSLSFLNILDYGLWVRLKINLNGIKAELIKLSISGCFSSSRAEGLDKIKMRDFEVIKSTDQYKEEWIKCFNDERINTLYLHHPDIMEKQQL